MELTFLRQIFEKYQNMKINKNPLSGSRVVQCGRTDRGDETTDCSNFVYTCIKTNRLEIHREIMAVFSEIHTKHINTLCGQNVELLNVKLAVHIVTTGL